MRGFSPSLISLLLRILHTFLQPMHKLLRISQTKREVISISFPLTEAALGLPELFVLGFVLS